MIKPTNKLELFCDGCGLWFEEFDPGSDVEAKLRFHRVTPVSDGEGGAKHHCVECFNALLTKRFGQLLEKEVSPQPSPQYRIFHTVGGLGIHHSPPFGSEEEAMAWAKENEAHHSFREGGEEYAFDITEDIVQLVRPDGVDELSMADFGV